MLPGIRIIPGIIGSRRLVERTVHARRRAKNGMDSQCSAKNHVEKWRPRTQVAQNHFSSGIIGRIIGEE